MPDPLPDDIDQVFMRAGAVDPPEDFLQHVMIEARTGEEAEARSNRWGALVLYASVYIAAMAGLAVLAYELGIAVARNGTATLAGVLINDLDLMVDAPNVYLTALLASLPVWHVGAVAIDLVLIAIVTRLILKRSAGRASRPASHAGA